MRTVRRRWAARLTLLVVTLAGGCQGGGGTPLAMSQVPPTVQAAFAEEHPGAVVRSVARRTERGQDLYTVDYSGGGGDHGVVYNGAGDEVDRN